MNDFRIARYRFHLRAGERGLDLPPFKGSALRGVMGRVMRSLSCVDMGRNCQKCDLNTRCPYAYVFETQPSPAAGMMKGYDQVPRPYVIEPGEVKKDFLAAGETMSFDLLLFGQAISLFPYFFAAFLEGGRLGLGTGKKHYKLQQVDAVNQFSGFKKSIYNIGEQLRPDQGMQWRGEDILVAAAALSPVQEVMIEYVTPTQLMADRKKMSHLDDLPFSTLMRNIFRRYSSLYVHHHDQLPSEDYSLLLELAEKVECMGGEGRVENWERYSMRGERRNQMEGFTGRVGYRGSLDRFIPYLILGQWLHLGKWTAFGMGRYRCIFKIEK